MVQLSDVQQARELTAPHIRRTPMSKSETLSRRFGTNVYLKYELFQKTGSFKPRGAFNQILQLTDEQKAKGVVAVSGGNFAQAVAYAAQKLGIKAHICMPEFTPKNYVNGTKSYGAEVHFGPTLAETFAINDQFAQQGFTSLHAWDNHFQVAGTGTIGFEILEDLPQATDVFISIGGGGLIAGNIISLKALKPNIRIWGVETEGAQTMDAALKAGKVVNVQPSSLAKTLGAPYASQTSFELCQKHLAGLVVVSDKEAFSAQVYLLERAKVLTELAASCTFAAAEKVKPQLGEHVVLLLCGGNSSLANLNEYREKLGEPTPL